MTFERVTRAVFDELLANNGSERFRRELARYDLESDPPARDDCAVLRGPLAASDFVDVPAFNTLVMGDLTVDGLIDLGSAGAFDEGGVFVVLGNVASTVFSTGFAKGTFIDGNLEADSLILNAYDDSALVVRGNLRTYFFYGRDIWAEVGGKAEMHYGDGYCLPIGYTSAGAEAIEPLHDRATSLRRLNLDSTDYIEPHRFLDLIRSGRPIFK
ncbi:hypothetical protein Q3C01_03690 [Bradyrhizobium sp. UFLA05-109]